MIFLVPISLIIIAIIVLGIAGARWIETELSGFLTFMFFVLLIGGTIAFFIVRWIFSESTSESRQTDEHSVESSKKTKEVYTFELECPECGCIFECDFDTSYIPSGTEVICPDCEVILVVED